MTPTDKEGQLDFADRIREGGDALYKRLYQMLKPLLMAKLVSILPILGNTLLNPIISFAIGYALRKLLPYIIDNLETGFIFMGIDMKVSAQLKRYLKAEATVEETESMEEKVIAQRETDIAFTDFVNLN